MTWRSKLDAPLSSMEIGLEFITIAGCVLHIFILIQVQESLPDLMPGKLDMSSRQPIFGVSKSFFMGGTVWGVITNLGVLLASRNPYTCPLILKDFYKRFNLHKRLTERQIQQHYQIVRSLIHWANMQLTYLSLLYCLEKIQLALGKPEKMNPLFLPVISITIASILAYHLFLLYKTANVHTNTHLK